MADSTSRKTTTPEAALPEALRPVVVAIPVSVRDLAEKLELKPTVLITELIKQGVMAAINERLDFKTAASVALKFEVELTEESALASSSATSSTAKQKGQPRPPVVAVMGHVDHGKTSLLDKIRKTTVADSEAGGITQHLRAHQVSFKGRSITLLDTPGHAAFSLLREHGAHLTDIAVIVVAADDGVKPQTTEAIKFAQKAGVKIVVAITKTDKPNIDLNRLKQQLADLGLSPEDWGGETVMIETSAKTGAGLDKLLEMILLITDLEKLQAPLTGPASGTVIETRMAKGKGILATLLVENGQLAPSDYLVAGTAYGRVRRLESMEGKALKSAGPSTPVVVSGWKEIPDLGQTFTVVADEKTARLQMANPNLEATVQTASSPQEKGSTQTVNTIGQKQLPVVIKADVHGSLEAILQSLSQLNQGDVVVKVVRQGLGPISESDVQLAGSAGAQIIGFNVSVPIEIKQLAQRQKVPIRLYNVIYELIDEARAELDKLFVPTFSEQKAASLEIKGIFKVTKNSLICGGLVSEGKIRRELKVRLQKDQSKTIIGKVANVQKGPQDAKEVSEGELCGLNIATEHKVTPEIGDILDFYEMVEDPKVNKS